jgi:PKD repeat protein
MTVLPDVAPSREFPITWTGVDDTEGSALAGFDVYVSDNGSDFDLWLENTTVNAGTYPGEDGHRYAFYTVSRDNAGNVEDAPLEPDAETITSGFSAITGMKFEDIDEDGVKDDGEPGMGGFTIFLDLDADGELDDNEVRTITGTDGTYELAGITAGTHRVAEAPKPGWRQSFPAESFYVIELLDGETASSTDFGNFGVPAPTAGFSANPLQGNEPLLVVFTNNSTSDATSFAWDFGLDTDSDEDGDPANDVDTTATSTVAVYMEGRYSVSLQGVSGTTTLSAIAPTVTLESGTGVDATSTTMLLGTDGSFQFMHAPDGAYTISVDAPGFLQAMRVNLIVTGGAVVMPTVDLRAGRVNTDDIVNILDVSATAASFLQIVVGRVDAYGRVVDVNGDGIVNINDLTAVTSNFTLVNPQIW